MRDIIDGFLRFQREVYPQRVELFKQLATSQNPKALFVTCSDSRVVPELLTQREPGELFVIRNAGNIVPSYGPEPGGVSATVEYAVAVLGVQDIVICGHSDCGAMGAISRCTCLDHLPAVANWLRHADAAKAINAAHEAKGDAGWGNQIRSYVLQPYQMVKDLRTGYTSPTPSDVLDGDLDPFMAAALAQRGDVRECCGVKGNQGGHECFRRSTN